MDTKVNKKKIIFRSRSKNHLEQVYGFEKNKFKGNSLDLYNRATVYYNDFSANLLTDKDIGEVYLADFYSGNISGKIKNTKFILGDYYLKLGMGTLFWASYPIGKGAEVIYPVLQEGSGIKPYKSSISYNYFRGLAVEHKINLSDNSDIKLISWYSNRNPSATIDTVNNVASSIYKMGYFRTENEIKKKNALNEQSYGINAEYVNDLFKVGAISDYMLYNKSIVSASSSIFSGKEGLLLSTYAFVNLGIGQIGVELSRDNNNNISIKAGSELDFDDIDFAFAYRRFPEDFRSQFGYNFGEFSYVSNEQGLYTGIKYKGLRKFIFSAYIDLYSSFAPTFFVDKPVKGVDLFLQTKWKISSKSNLYLRIRNENKTDAVKNLNSEKKILQKQVSRFRLEYSREISDITFRIRTELSYVNFRDWIKDEFGIMSSFDLYWNVDKKFNIMGRIALFSTSSYESAIWQFEMTVPGYLSTRALYGRGVRAFLTCKYSPFDFFDLRLAYTAMYKPDEESLGTSYLKINSNIDNRLIFQIDMQL